MAGLRLPSNHTSNRRSNRVRILLVAEGIQVGNEDVFAYYMSGNGGNKVAVFPELSVGGCAQRAPTTVLPACTSKPTVCLTDYILASLEK